MYASQIKMENLKQTPKNVVHAHVMPKQCGDAGKNGDPVIEHVERMEDRLEPENVKDFQIVQNAKV